ncbi:hypothetical protein ALC57_14861 [Trachymyrmex cornetzi]|uniref:Uncharacterized protein n=1 Tax=Trachymyrmex cornetzi TaxID=471704 RepID=A0A151IXP0_9HYME|nr:hypothetical protein ALC57_14861 [Trachymyrmex cornetzi]
MLVRGIGSMKGEERKRDDRRTDSSTGVNRAKRYDGCALVRMLYVRLPRKYCLLHEIESQLAFFLYGVSLSSRRRR